jgi:hypothetical protein
MIRQSEGARDLQIATYVNFDQASHSSGLRLTRRKDGYYEEEGGQIWRRSREGQFDVFTALNFFGDEGYKLVIWP